MGFHGRPRPRQPHRPGHYKHFHVYVAGCLDFDSCYYLGNAKERARMIDDSVVLAVIAILCFLVGFLVRGELPKLFKKKEQKK